MARDRNESYQQYVRETEEMERQEKEKMKWELLKRCRMSEHDKAVEEKEKELERQKKKIQRRNLDTQMVRKRRAGILKLELIFYAQLGLIGLPFISAIVSVPSCDHVLKQNTRKNPG